MHTATNGSVEIWAAREVEFQVYLAHFLICV